jgi:hypothetical protein
MLKISIVFFGSLALTLSAHLSIQSSKNSCSAEIALANGQGIFY